MISNAGGECRPTLKKQRINLGAGYFTRGCLLVIFIPVFGAIFYGAAYNVAGLSSSAAVIISAIASCPIIMILGTYKRLTFFEDNLQRPVVRKTQIFALIQVRSEEYVISGYKEILIATIRKGDTRAAIEKNLLKIIYLFALGFFLPSYTDVNRIIGFEVVLIPIEDGKEKAVLYTRDDSRVASRIVDTIQDIAVQFEGRPKEVSRI